MPNVKPGGIKYQSLVKLNLGLNLSLMGHCQKCVYVYAPAPVYTVKNKPENWK